MRKLNVGCHRDYREGYINLDCKGFFGTKKKFVYNKGWINLDEGKSKKPDIIHNLNNYPYPFEDNESHYYPLKIQLYIRKLLLHLYYS